MPSVSFGFTVKDTSSTACTMPSSVLNSTVRLRTSSSGLPGSNRRAAAGVGGLQIDRFEHLRRL